MRGNKIYVYQHSLITLCNTTEITLFAAAVCFDASPSSLCYCCEWQSAAAPTGL